MSLVTSTSTLAQLDAVYEYGPFGEPLRATGAMAKANPFRFSTKYTDEETGLCYYGRRFYDANRARWINREPIAERGGINLYGFVRNNPPTFFDKLGCLKWIITDEVFVPPGTSKKTSTARL